VTSVADPNWRSTKSRNPHRSGREPGALHSDFVNAHGGIHGRTITDKILDDAYNPAKTVTDVRQLVLQDQVFAIFNGPGTPTHEAILPFLNDEGGAGPVSYLSNAYHLRGHRRPDINKGLPGQVITNSGCRCHSGEFPQ
jgi:hypothetical protein